MDLEEELSLFQQEDVAADAGVNGVKSGPEEANESLLGLDQSIKLTTRAKVAKIDNERIFDKNKGLNYIVENHQRLGRVLKRRDKLFEKKLSGNRNLSSGAIKRMRQENEYENLSSVLQFYQLWCHGLFPKAKFRDCLQLLRGFGQRSSQLKLYRRELIEQEIYKLKTERGLVSAEEEKRGEIDAEPGSLADSARHDVSKQGNNEDNDWSFMERESGNSNGLFIDDGEDLYHSPSQSVHVEEEGTTSSLAPHTVTESRLGEAGNMDDNSSENPFSDDDFSQELISGDASTLQTKVSEVPDLFTEKHTDDYEDEMDVMREMGL